MIRLSRRHMLRRGLALAALGLAAGCGVVSFPGQQQPAIRRIGYLRESVNPETFGVFRDGLRDLGYVEGQDLVIEVRDPEGSMERLPTLAAELVSLPVEVIVAGGPFSALAAAQVTSTIPIVVASSNAVLSLVSNIARPEGNITGVATNNVAAVGKWIELLKETVPSLSHLAALGDQSSPQGSPNRAQVEGATRALQIGYTWYGVSDLDELPAVLATVVAQGADGLVVISGGIIGGGADPRIGLAVLQSGLPAVGDVRAFAANGGLLAHGVDTLALHRRSAVYVDKLLKGAKPGDLPIELPTQFNIVINLNSARELGITVPASVLARATEIIQ